MNRRSRSFGLGAVVFAATIVLGYEPSQSRRPLREIQSDNHAFTLRFRPGNRTTRKCRATLYAGETKPRKVWEEKLANETSPVLAFVRDDGRFVVTLDEFRLGGARHTLVVYDKRGRNLREFTLSDLLTQDDWKRIKPRGRAIEWLEEAQCAFADPDQFVVRLKWNRVIRIDLRKLTPIWAASESPADKSQIPAKIQALLSQAERDPKGGARPQGGAAFEEILSELIEQSEENTGHFPFDKLTTLIDYARALAAGAAEGGHPTAGASTGAEREPSDDQASLPTVAGTSAETGISVPMPQPGNHVDYLAWLNQHTVSSDSRAVELTQSAIDGVVRSEFDSELLKSAMRGDAEALASPEVRAWVDANLAALADLRQASHLEYAGWPLQSEDGTMLNAVLPHLSPLRELSRVAIVDAKALEADGHVDQAVDHYVDMMAAATHVGGGVTLIENLVGLAMQASTSEALLDTFAGSEAENIDYVDLSQRLEQRMGSMRSMDQTVQFERATLMDVTQRIYDREPVTGEYRVAPNGLEYLRQVTGMVNGDGSNDEADGDSPTLNSYESFVRTANDMYDRMSEAMRMPYAEGRDALRSQGEQLSDPAFRAKNPILGLFVPSLGRAWTIRARGDATRHATLLITRLQAYRQQHGSYPETLSAVGDDLPDPFTGAPFAYQLDGNGFRLYSLSDNGTDDGGVHDRSAKTGDLVYWPRPPRD